MTAFDPSLPFVLLDDAHTGVARLFTGLRATVVATTVAEVRPALDRLHTGGPYAGFIGYDAAPAFEAAIATSGPIAPAASELPLVWFGAFDKVETIDPAAIIGDRRAAIGPLVPDIDAATYAGRVAEVGALIAAGDIYQANLTFGASVATTGHPLGLYRRLRAGSAAPYGALVHTGAAWLLSFSPELFFTLHGGRLTTRPMKGTARRGATAAADDAAAAALATDPKNRAENLMIVDLLRNDLSRVAEPGSVAVPDLFTVERYPTLLQMTSTVTATTRAGPVDVLAALFPCGSITGAPKIRAMQIIAEIEGRGRGLYTGNIGHVSGGDAAFNVAIRTLVMTRRGEARLGLGAGIVADSVAADEWRECLSKGAFLTREPPPDIIETMRVEGGTVALLDHHLARAAATARFLGTPLDIEAIATTIATAAAEATGRLRLLVSPRGAVAIQLSPLPAALVAPVEVAVVPLPVTDDDWRLRHKTTDRGFYDDARAASGAHEVVLVRPDGRITEGSFTTVFVARADGMLLTPPLADGVLPGVLRAALIDAGRAVEAPLTSADLANGFLIGNALRGLIAACLA